MRKERGSILSGMIYIFFLIVLVVLLFALYQIYSENNFDGFSRSEKHTYSSNFVKDRSVQYNGLDSYKIESNTFNDAMLSKKINVKPNTPYKVSCMAKLDEVVTKQEPSCGGVHICVADTLERSEAISGTSDWQKVEFYFNSKNRDKVEIGLRLGGYDDECTGKVWFSDLMLEEGMTSDDTNWNFALFIVDNIDVNIQNKDIKIGMTEIDVNDMKVNMGRFKTSIAELSNGNITIDYDIFRISNPITTLTYDETNGYYVSPKDVKNLINPYMQKEEYDHVFVAVRLGDELHTDDIEVFDWIGLRRNGLLWNRFFKYKIA